MELNLLNKLPTTIFEDNQAAIKMSNNDFTTKRSKHVLIKFHYTKEQVQNGNLKIVYCATEKMCADLLTKSLGKTKTRRFAKDFGLVETSPAEEGVEDIGSVTECAGEATSIGTPEK